MKAALSGRTIVLFAPRSLTIGSGDVELRNISRTLLDEGYKDLVLDVSELRRVDSSGVGELVSLFTNFSNRGGSLTLNHLSGPLRDILEITQLITVFEVVNVDHSNLKIVEVEPGNISALTALDRKLFDPQVLILAIREGRYQILPATREGIYRVRTEAPGEEFLLSSPHIVASSTRSYLADQISEFEDIINSSRSSESDLQKFLELNPTFLLGQEYESLHPHLVLEREEDEGVLIPDFLLRPFDSDLCDIIELKKPTHPLVVGSTNRLRFSAAVSEAAAQLRTYRRYFDDPKNRERTKQRYGVTSYLPRLAVIIGRRADVDPLLLRTVRDGENIDVITYDDLLERAKRFKVG